MDEYVIEIVDDLGEVWEYYPDRFRRDGMSRNLILRGDNSKGGGYWASGLGNAKHKLMKMGYITEREEV